MFKLSRDKRHFYRMMFTLAAGVTLCFLTTAVMAQESGRQKRIEVGTKEAPPFSMKNADGTWSGISMDLWKEIARRHNLRYDIKEYQLDGLIKAVETGQADIAVAALTITPEREKVLDFSHAFYVEGLGIAVGQSNERGWLQAVKRFASFEFLSVICVLALVLLFFGYLGWLFERHQNDEEFPKDFFKGVGSGFWWSAVTMTTVGYGDKSPRTLGGRVVALIWMFTSIIIISSFTAAITSAVTVSQLESGINGPQDLVNAKLGSVEHSSSMTLLKERNIHPKTFGSLPEALTELRDGKLDAVVYDAPLLQYIIKNDFADSLKVLPNTFIDQPYGFAFSSNHPMREKINQSLLEITSSSRWQEIIRSYLGDK